jgi:hypothetical protein
VLVQAGVRDSIFSSFVNVAAQSLFSGESRVAGSSDRVVRLYSLLQLLQAAEKFGICGIRAPFVWRRMETVLPAYSIQGGIMTSTKRCLLGAAILVLVFSFQAFSQTASIGGTVIDTSGGVLRGAKITVTNYATNIEQAVTTNTAGMYAIPGVQVGTYKITAAMPGFQTQTKTDLRVGVVADRAES